MDSGNNDDLRNEAPNLFGMEKKNPFEVPAGFFDNFSSKVQDKIISQQKQTIWWVIYHNLIKPKIAVPVLASVCIIAVGIRFLNKTAVINTNQEVAITYSDLTESDYFAEIDVNDLSEALNNSTGTVSNNIKTESDKHQIENYLIENNVDVNDLANELN